MARQYKVGIIGFGVAGGAAACLLAQAGHHVTIFESAPQVGPVGTGLLLQPSGQMVLQALDLLEPIAAQSEPITKLHAFKPDGRTLVYMRYDELGSDCHAYGVHRGTLFQALHEKACRAGVSIRLNHKIVSWRTLENGVAALDSENAEFVSDEGPFDFLIAADGSRSTLRHHHQEEGTVRGERDYDYGAMWSVGRCTQVRGYLHQVVDGTQHLLGMLPIGGDRCTLFWSLRSDHMKLVRERGFDDWREKVIRLCPLAAEPLGEMEDFTPVAFTTYRHLNMRRKYTNSVVWLGDAAHSMSPHLGQGANLALLDAACLAATLAESDFPLDAFRRYHQMRRLHTFYISTLSKFLTPFFQNDGWFLGFGRDLFLPLLCSFSPTRKLMEMSVAGLPPRQSNRRSLENRLIKLLNS